MNTKLKLTSHVGRDLLAAAGSFKKEDSVVWEYVVNGLQYADPGAIPNIKVNVLPKAKGIEIIDNGRGMSIQDLEGFFTMHGENIDRMRGRPGRGKFGTGKSAAFGIAGQLNIETVQNGFKNCVELTRDMIDQSNGEDIAVNWLEKEIPTDLANGTMIKISNIYLEKLSVPLICSYIERHLGAFRQTKASVAVNNHLCEYLEPEFSESHIFKPNIDQAELLGNIELIIKVSKIPLEPSSQGIVVMAGTGNTVAIEDGGISGKEFGNYLFGSVDVHALETSDSKIQPYDASRSLQLNPAHPTASVLLGFIGSKLDEVRRKLVKESKEAQKTEEARRLAQEAAKLADIINEDYEQYRDRLEKIRSATSRPGNVDALFGNSQQGENDADEYVKGFKQRGILESSTSLEKGNNDLKKGNIDPNIGISGKPDQQGPDTLDPVGGTGKKKSKPRGGFDVKYQNLGPEEYRSRYDSTSLAILINLDHPVVKNALNHNGPEDISFRRLVYEIAFIEYSMAIGYELIKQDPEMPPDDLMFEVRSTLNRVSRAAAFLYTL